MLLIGPQDRAHISDELLRRQQLLHVIRRDARPLCQPAYLLGWLWFRSVADQQQHRSGLAFQRYPGIFSRIQQVRLAPYRRENLDPHL